MITVDDREEKEANEHHEVSIPDIIGINCRVERLDSGDYAFLDFYQEPVGIERCEVSNLVQKLRSGELEDQLYRCQDSYSSVILLKEGVYDEVNGLLATHKKGNRGYYRDFVYPHTQFELIKAAEIRLSEMGIEVIDSPNFPCSISIVKLIHDLRTKPEKDRTLFKKIRTIHLPVKLSANPAVPKLMGLIPHLSEKAAIGLIYKYDTIWGVLNAPDKELLKVDGVGKGMIRNLRKSIGKGE